MANQVFLRCGVETFGWPATWEKAVKAVERSLKKLVGDNIAGQITMVDGAGLSRKNRITAGAMLTVLDKFRPYSSLLQEKKEVQVKSGTLDGVYNYSGYLEGDRPFVILLNQKHNTRDQIMRRLQLNTR